MLSTLSTPATVEPPALSTEYVRQKLRFYRGINRCFRSYSLKFLVIAFFGIHLPLIALVLYLAVVHGWKESRTELLVVLVATLLGTALTLWSQFNLLAPIRVSTRAFAVYRLTRKKVPLPHEFADEAGQLMHESSACIDELSRLLVLKDHLAAGIAHDFRSPLASIVMASDLLGNSIQPGSPQHTLLLSIRRAAVAQTSQIDGLLHAVLDDTRNARFDFLPVEVDRLWAATRDMLGLFANQRNVILDFQPTSARVGGDEARLTQVLNNLVSNAIKATPTGARVTISAEPAGHNVAIHVRDQGPGVDAVRLRAALAASAETQAIAGPSTPALGLGLRMVGSLLHLHASQLRIDRRVEGGSDFWFELRSVT